MSHRWLIAVASRLVPKGLRAEWAAEWRAEVEARDRQRSHWPRARRVSLARISLGALADAWWLRTNSWSTWRLLRNHWRLAMPAVASLAIGIAAVTIGLATYNALLIRLPGVEGASSLRFVDVGTRTQPFAGTPTKTYQRYRSQLRSFSGLAAFGSGLVADLRLQDGTQHAQVSAADCSDNFFTVLGVKPLRGRLAFDAAAKSPEIVISESLWRKLGAEDSLVGRAVRLEDSGVVIVVGVVPETFRGLRWGMSPDLWQSSAIEGRAGESSPPVPFVSMIGRLAPGTSDASATTEVSVVANATIQSNESSKQPVATLSSVSLTPPGSRSGTRFVVGGLVLALSLALVVAGVNVINLLLALGTLRRHELLVRTTLGASRAQLVIPHLRETCGLGLLAGVVGFVLAFGGLTFLSSIDFVRGGPIPPLRIDLHPDLLVLSASIFIALVAGILVGTLPAMRASTDGLTGAINREAGPGTPRKARLRKTLIAMQVAMATFVLVAMAASLRSLASLRQAPSEFAPFADRVTMVGLSLGTYNDWVSHPLDPGVLSAARDRLAALPDVEAVGLADGPIVASHQTPFEVVDPALPMPGRQIGVIAVDDHYFSATGLRVLAGRGFDDRDRLGAPEVAIVDASLAHEAWGDHSPIGHRLRLDKARRVVEIIGVAASSKHEGLFDRGAGFVYLALAQHPSEEAWAIVRGRSAATRPSSAEIATALQHVDAKFTQRPNLDVLSIDGLIGPELMMPRAAAVFTTILGVVVLVLATIGLYSAVFYAVAQRRTEIGVHVALGARPAQLFRLVLKDVGVLGIAGGVAGLVSSAVALRWSSSLLYDIRPVELTLTALAACASLLVAVGTAYVVARPWLRLPALELLVRF